MKRQFMLLTGIILVVLLPITVLVSQVNVPVSVDLRPYLTPVKHQGKRNTCSVFAATALMEYLIKTKTGKQLDLSENYNYWAGKKYILTGKFLKKSYKNIDGLAGFLAVQAYCYGSMLEKDWPYFKRNWIQTNDPRCTYINSKPASKCFTGLLPANASLLSYRLKPIYIRRGKIGQFILTEKKPVVFNVFWYYNAVNNQTGEVRMPRAHEMGKRGGHVILLVGYNSRTKTFIFRNSWGPKWGDGGYGTIPEAYINQYYEVSRSMPYLSRYSSEIQRFLIRAGKGASGYLVDLKK